MRLNKVEWELGGLMDEEQGRLTRRGLPVGDLFGIPEQVWVEGGRLHYRYVSPFGKPRDAEDGMLDAFVRLEDEPDVLKFAQRWGPLRLCSHNLTSRHGTQTIFFDVEGKCETGKDEEPLEAWFLWADSARALLSVAANLHQGQEPSLDVWRRAEQMLNPRATRASESTVRQSKLWESQIYCGDLVWAWLDIARISPKFTWDGTPQFFLWTDAFGTLGLQLAQAIARSHGLAVCDGCGVAYMRQGRKPQVGRRNYCQSCGKKAAVRDAQRALRLRKREGDGQEKS